MPGQLVTPGKPSLTVRVGTQEWSLPSVHPGVGLQVRQLEVGLLTPPVLALVRLVTAVLLRVVMSTGAGAGGDEADDEVVPPLLPLVPLAYHLTAALCRLHFTL